MLGRLSSRLRRHPAVCAAVVVLVAASAALGLASHSPRLPLGRAAAVGTALKDPGFRSALAGARWNTITVSAIDRSLDRVTFAVGARVVAQAAVRSDRSVVAVEDYQHGQVRYGAAIANQPAVLIGLAALFVLAAAVVPLRRLRNLDVAVALSLLAPLVLLQRRYLDASAVSAVPPLLYLMGRCLWRAIGYPRPPGPSTPFLHALTSGWDPYRRVRLLRLLAGALAFTFVIVTVSSAGAVDVLYAAMEGATKLISGVLPYGHMPGDVIHGDTYPILTYALYAPLAWLAPVQSTWSSVDVGLAASAAAALAIGCALYLGVAGSRRRTRTSSRARSLGPRPLQQEEAGLRAALTWLAFPLALVATSTGSTDVALGAMLMAAVLLWQRPTISTGVLSAAAWFKLAPLALLPVWLAPLRGRRLAGALAAVAIVSLPMICLVVAIGGLSGPMEMVRAVSFQFSRGSLQSGWSALSLQSLQPLGQAAVLALIVGVAVRLRREPALAADQARIAGLSAAILIGLQLVADYWTFVYLAWVVALCGRCLLSDAPAIEVAPEAASSRTPGWLPIGNACPGVPGSGTSSSVSLPPS